MIESSTQAQSAVEETGRSFDCNLVFCIGEDDDPIDVHLKQKSVINIFTIESSN